MRPPPSSKLPKRDAFSQLAGTTPPTALGRCGAPYGQYLLGDVLAGRVRAKLQVFLAAWALSPAKRAALAEQRGPGVTRVWCYAPGYLFPDRADVAGIGEVTGFEARAASVATAQVAPTDAGKKLGLAASWGPAVPIVPLFSVTATPEETLATYADGTPAVAMRRSEKGIDVFVGVPQLTPELLRALARPAGVSGWISRSGLASSAGSFTVVTTVPTTRAICTGVTPRPCEPGRAS